MNQTIFDLIAQIMRIWFALLLGYILFRLLQSLWREYSATRDVRKAAKGYQMGLLEVIEPVENHKLYGKRFALKRENRIGRAGKCDICIRERSLKAVHAEIYQKGSRVFLRDYGTRTGVYLNGERVGNDIPLIDGDEIALGSVLLRLHLRGGLSATREQRAEKAHQLWEQLDEYGGEYQDEYGVEEYEYDADDEYGEEEYEDESEYGQAYGDDDEYDDDDWPHDG